MRKKIKILLVYMMMKETKNVRKYISEKWRKERIRKA